MHLVEALLSDVRLPRDARRRSSAPVRELRTPASIPASPDLVDRKAWWTLPGSVTQTLSYVQQAGVPGCRFGLSGSSSGAGHRTVRDIGCSAVGTAFASKPQVLIEAVSTGHGAAVRVDSQAVWTPARKAFSRVLDPSSVGVVVERAGKEPTVRRTLGRSDAANLADVLNGLEVYPPSPTSCPSEEPGINDALRFRTSTGTVTAKVGLSGCPEVDVTAPGHKSSYLTGADSVDTVVREELHLGRSYRT